MKLVLLASGMLAIGLSAGRAETITGAVLADMCAKHEPRASYYILGAVDAFNVKLGAPKRFCIPAGAQVPSNHLANIICKYVVEHTADQDRDAAVLTFRALRDEFPCQGRA